MINNNLGILKYVGLVLLLFFAVTACEKDIENIGVDLVDNGVFDVGDSLIDITSYNINIDSSRVDNNNINSLPGYLMGVNQNSNFGYLKSSVISQLRLPAFGVYFGDNAIIDLVVLDIPYYATKDTIQYATDPITGEELEDEDGNPIFTPSYSLDSIYGNTDIEFEIKISELETFLNVLDPENPTKNKTYFSDKEYQVSNELFLGNFKPNRNDTVLYVERRFLDWDSSTVNDVDTVKAENASPSMKFFLNKEFFKTRFVDNQDSPFFDSNDRFIHYFKGMFIESNGFDGSLINFPTAASKMTIYYTNEEIRTEGEDEDLNYNGIKGEEDVLVRLKREMSFNFGGVRTGQYTRNYSGSAIERTILNPDKINGEAKLYVQGAAGSESIIKLFSLESLHELRNKDWLINEANLTLYIDKNSQIGEVPQQLFLYNYDNRTILSDLERTGFEVYGGKLEYDDDGNPKSYKFRITYFISSILDANDPEEPATLALKTYNGTDMPNFNLFGGSIVKNYSWIPKGVVLHGNLSNDIDKRLKLEIFYSK